MAIYLKLDGVDGNVTAKGYEKWIQVDTCHFGVSRDVTMEAGKTANRESVKPRISEVSITKRADNSVAALFKEAVVGKKGRKAELAFVRTGEKALEQFMGYKLKNVLVSGYSISADGDEETGGSGEPIENLSLSFTECEIEYKDHAADNSNSNPKRAGYNLELAEPI